MIRLNPVKTYVGTNASRIFSAPDLKYHSIMRTTLGKHSRLPLSDALQNTQKMMNVIVDQSFLTQVKTISSDLRLLADCLRCFSNDI